MENIVSTTIKNNLPFDTVLGWTKRREWLGAHSSITLDYDPWSCGDKWQRKAIESTLRDTGIEITLHVTGKDGVVHDILMGLPEIAPVTVKTESAAAVQSTITVQNDNTVTAVNAEATKYGFKAEEVKPKGFDKSVIDTESDSFTVSTADVLNKDSVAGIADDASDFKEAVDDTAEKFDALCAEHKWADALKLLIEKFGEDKITFTTRAIMSLKTYAAVCEKYELK